MSIGIEMNVQVMDIWVDAGGLHHSLRESEYAEVWC
jgi:hypothetical protein